MSDKSRIGYVEGQCTCGTPYKVYIDTVPGVIKMVRPAEPETDKGFTHSLVFYCEGCHRDKTIHYTDLDVRHDEIPAKGSGP